MTEANNQEATEQVTKKQVRDLPAETLNDEALLDAARARAHFLAGGSEVTLWRWKQRFEDFPPAVRIAGRKYYRVGDLRQFAAARAVENAKPRAKG